MKSSRSAVVVLGLLATLTACGPVGPDPRCADRASEVGPPADARTAPDGWPTPPPGDVVCGTASYVAGDYGGSVETLVAVTDRPFRDVLDHYEGAVPAAWRFWRFDDGDGGRIFGDAGGTVFSIEAAGEGRYALTFQVLARPDDLRGGR